MKTCSLLGIILPNYLPISIVEIVRTRKMISTEFGSEEMLIVEKKKGGSDRAEANLGTFFPITCDATRRQNQQFLKLHHKLNNS